MSKTVERREGDRLPDITIQTVARGFYREARNYGFRQADYLRFMNSLLSLATPANGAELESERPLVDADVTIRPLDRTRDLAELQRWVSDPQGRYFLLARTLARPLTLEEIVDDARSVVGIVTLPDGSAIGATAFLDWDPEQRKAELRKIIGEPGLRGRGYGKAATRLWLRYGFETLKLHKIYLSTLDTNIRNIRLNEHLGFQVEGVLHDEVLVDGAYHDVLRMAILEEI